MRLLSALLLQLPGVSDGRNNFKTGIISGNCCNAMIIATSKKLKINLESR